MHRSPEELLAALRSFEPSADEADNVHRLSELCADLPSGSALDRSAEHLLALVERFPQAGFGTPAPLVRRLETAPAYADLLAASLERQPTELTAWMANRLLNTPLPRDDRLAWLQRLTRVTTHPLAPRPLRESAIRFLDFQASRSGKAP